MRQAFHFLYIMLFMNKIILMLTNIVLVLNKYATDEGFPEHLLHIPGKQVS
jgi:hypothetical protein